MRQERKVSSSKSVGSMEEGSTYSSIRGKSRKRSKKKRVPVEAPRAIWAFTKRWRGSQEDLTCSSSSSSLGGFLDEKKVRFSPHTTEQSVPSWKFMDLAERAELWYSRCERDIMRREARCETFKTGMLCPQYAASLEKTYKNARYISTINDADEIATLLDDPCVVQKFSKDLFGWTNKEDESFRGLEDWVSQQQRVERREQVVEARSMVVAMSKRKISLRRIAGADDMVLEYQRLSRCSLVLARWFAAADAYAVPRATDDCFFTRRIEL